MRSPHLWCRFHPWVLQLAETGCLYRWLASQLAGCLSPQLPPPPPALLATPSPQGLGAPQLPTPLTLGAYILKRSGSLFKSWYHRYFALSGNFLFEYMTDKVCVDVGQWVSGTLLPPASPTPLPASPLQPAFPCGPLTDTDVCRMRSQGRCSVWTTAKWRCVCVVWAGCLFAPFPPPCPLPPASWSHGTRCPGKLHACAFLRHFVAHCVPHRPSVACCLLPGLPQAVDEAVSKKQKFAFLLTTRSGRQLFLACETAAQSEHVRLCLRT